MSYLNRKRGAYTCLYRNKVQWNESLKVVGKVEDVKEEVGPSDAGDAAKEEAAGEAGPAVGGLKGIGLLGAAGEGEGGGNGGLSLLEGGNAVYGKADAEDDHQARCSWSG